MCWNGPQGQDGAMLWNEHGRVIQSYSDDTCSFDRVESPYRNFMDNTLRIANAVINDKYDSELSKKNEDERYEFLLQLLLL